MKTRISLLTTVIFMIFSTQAQDYQISFTGSGQSITVDSIQVENLTQGTTLSLSGNDILNLVGALGISTLNVNENKVQVYPNPMIESTFVEFKNQNPQTISMEVFNELSTLIVKKDVMVQNGLQRFEISGLNTGIYILVVSSKEWTYSAKIISLGEKSKNATIKQQSVDLGSTHERAVESTKDLVEMQYNDGEMILFKGFSGNYARVLTLLPTQSQAIDFEFIPCSDEDGNNYAVVTIGTQTWMAENLKTTKYNDGTDIPLVTDGDSWVELTTPAYRWYNNDITNEPTYGALYNWYTVGTGNLCPTGWHVPTNSEWITLSDYLGGKFVAGGKLKETGTLHWWSPNTGATNESGFTCLPGGGCLAGFYDISERGYWWTSSVYAPTGAAFYVYLKYSSAINYYPNFNTNRNGRSIRCLRD